ncbi:hypothetical protein LGM14_11090 [Burkholderia multivorans]|nr:hypothetical protein [Burkholderia multivorans]
MDAAAKHENRYRAAQARLMDTAQGAVTAADIEQARNTLAQKFARLDHLAWAMVILTADAPPSGEDRDRQMLSATRWLQSLGLPFRHGNGLPASQPKGVPVAGMDVREYQYLAVADVRTAAIAAHCWPIEEQVTPSVLPLVDRAPTATKPKKGMTHSKPNWNVWHRMLKASLFDAVCLSCNVSPGAATLNPIQNGIAHLLGLDFAGWDVSREIADRLSIARSHAGTGGTLPTLTGDKDGEVYLATFAEWAVNTMEWSVPDELRAVAHAGPSDAGLDSLAARASTEDADDAPGTRSVIGWRIAVEKQLDKLMTAHGGIYPGHKAALKWFKANDAEAAFVPDNKDDEFTWVKADGKRVTSALKTFQNGMADILKSKQIPD